MSLYSEMISVNLTPPSPEGFTSNFFASTKNCTPKTHLQYTLSYQTAIALACAGSCIPNPAHCNLE